MSPTPRRRPAEVDPPDFIFPTRISEYTRQPLPEKTVHVIQTASEVLTIAQARTWNTAHNQNQANLLLHGNEYENYGLARQSMDLDYTIQRCLHKFSLANIPEASYIEAALLQITGVDDWGIFWTAQASNAPELGLLSNYSSFYGLGTLPVRMLARKMTCFLNPDIIVYLNEQIGGNAFIMTREYGYDFLNTVPPRNYWFLGSYYLPNYDPRGTQPELVIRYMT